jgi:hypothetical protein
LFAGTGARAAMRQKEHPFSVKEGYDIQTFAENIVI